MSEIRDPIHGFITPFETEFEIINTAIFQRLRKIKQLAMAYLVYPGANHTRFEHSLGVYHVASLMSDKLFPKKEDEDTRRIVRAAALLHDIGHGPFSHISEDILERFSDDAVGQKEKIHEKITASLISKNPEIDKILSKVEKDRVAGLLTGEKVDKTLMKDIVSGPVDADKMDYLLRDSYFCGVQYGKYDLARLLNTLTWYEDNNDSHICINFDGLNSLEQFVLAKYYMIKQVYQHRVRLISDAMIMRALELGIEKDRMEFLGKLYRFQDTEEYLENYGKYSDEKLVFEILSKFPKSTCAKIFEMLLSRSLFKQIFSKRLNELDINPDLKNKLIDISKKANKELREKLEEEISGIPQLNCDKDYVICESFKIKSVREMSRDSEASIIVIKGGEKRRFEDESTVFSSIDESMIEIYFEVYAPLECTDQRDKKEKEGIIKEAISEILKRGGRDG